MKTIHTNLRILINIFLCAALMLSASACKADTGINTAVRPIPTIDNRYILTDIAEHWAHDDIQNSLLMGIVKGYEDQTFRPGSSITRAEFITMLIRALYGEPVNYSYDNTFTDVAPSDWFYDTVHYARQNGITNGIDGERFAPKSDISREEIMLFVYRAIKKDASVTEHPITYTDISSSYKYINELKYAVKSGLISGYEDNTFRPSQKASRAETAVIIRRTLNSYSEQFKTDNDIKTASDKASEYLTKYVEAKNAQSTLWEYGIINSAGMEAYYNTVRQQLYDYYKSENIIVKQTLINPQIVQAQPLSASQIKIDLKYDSRYSRRIGSSNREKTVHVRAEVMLKRTGNDWQIYSVKENFYNDTPITLVWEQVYSPTITLDGLYHMDSLDIISPTWFHISKQETENSVKVSDNMHFVDYSNDDFVKNAHKNNYDIWAMFKSDFEPSLTSEFLRSNELKSSALSILIKKALTRSVDGINLDFENMNPADKDVYSQLVSEAAFLFREMGIITSVDVSKYHPYGGNWSLCYDRTALAQAVDYVCLMAYDQHSGGSKTAGSVGDMPWVEDAIKLTLTEVPSEKLLLGVPFYTRLWQEQNGTVVKSSALTMDSARSVIEENSAEIIFDEKTGQNYAQWEKDGSIYKIWIEDETSMDSRINLMKKYNLRGIAAWSRVQGNESIWNFMKTILK